MEILQSKSLVWLSPYGLTFRVGHFLHSKYSFACSRPVVFPGHRGRTVFLETSNVKPLAPFDVSLRAPPAGRLDGWQRAK